MQPTLRDDSPLSENIRDALADVHINFSLFFSHKLQFSNGEFSISIAMKEKSDARRTYSTLGTEKRANPCNSAFIIHSVQDHDDFIELLLLINKTKVDGFKKIIAILPYMFYGRQDRRSSQKENGSNTTSIKNSNAALMLRLIKASGANEIIVADHHSHIPTSDDWMISLIRERQYVRQLRPLRLMGRRR